MSLKEITCSPILPIWLIVLLFSLGIAALILQYPRLQKRVGSHRVLCISFLRLGSFLLLIGFFLNPAYTEKIEKRASPSLALILDTSASMDLPIKDGGISRLNEARSLLLEGKSPLLKSLADRFEVQVYGLGESLRPVEIGEIPQLKAAGKKGDLTAALKKMSSRNVLPILLSDGKAEWKGEGIYSLPLITIPIGNPVEFKDIWIQAVKAPSFTFRGREFRVEAVVKNHGYPQVVLPVSLKEGNKLLTARSIRIPSSPAGIHLSFSFTLEEAGQHHLSLSIPPQAGEATTLNNTFPFSIRVVKDKIRILMVSGHPSLNYRYMRTAFKSDPSIDLLSFVILRTPTDVLNVPLQEQSLIPFPVDTLFSKELQHFDLLIFDDFPFHLYVKQAYLENVRDFVKAGGGLILIGGPNLLDGGKYAGTPLEDVLPIAATGKGDYQREVPGKVRLTRTGRSHPITSLEATKKENLNLWREMPPLDGSNRVQVKTSATTLLESEDGTSQSILVVGKYGQGRVLVLATDYSWKWYMGMIAKGKGHYAYYRFLERAVRWVTKDPGLDPIQIILPEDGGVIGQKKEIRVRVRSEEDSPGSKAVAHFSVFDPRGLKVGTELRPSGPPGDYAAYFIPETPGIYKLKVEIPGEFKEETLEIYEPVEERDGRPDHERLMKIAEYTGGKFLFPTEDLLQEILRIAEKRESRYIEERLIPLWSHFFWLALVLALLSIEWYLRRRWGLI